MSRLLVISPDILCVAGCGYELWSHRGSFVDALPFLCVMAWAAVDAVLWVKADCAAAQKESES